MTTAQHTPTPWAYIKATVPDNTGGYDYAITVDGKIIAEVFQHTGWDDEKTGKYETQPVEANAAFIVRACNSHDALVEALEGNLRSLEGRLKPPFKTVKEWAESCIDSSDAKIKSEAKAILAMIAALALAKGE